MGLFDLFKKDSGKELFKENDAAEAKAEAIRQEIKRQGLGGNITVSVEGDKVKIGGQVPDQATKEKLMLIAGNTKHVRQVDDQMQPQAAAPAAAPATKAAAPQAVSQFYTVQSGDSLSKIAQRFYGDMQRYDEIFEANRPMLKDPDEIYPGQVLRIPNATKAAA
jgi:nucleoid-associated protein YgaU